jgi:hypothetical protein
MADEPTNGQVTAPRRPYNYRSDKPEVVPPCLETLVRIHRALDRSQEWVIEAVVDRAAAEGLIVSRSQRKIPHCKDVMEVIRIDSEETIKPASSALPAELAAALKEQMAAGMSADQILARIQGAVATQ